MRISEFLYATVQRDVIQTRVRIVPIGLSKMEQFLKIGTVTSKVTLATGEIGHTHQEGAITIACCIDNLTIWKIEPAQIVQWKAEGKT